MQENPINYNTFFPINNTFQKPCNTKAQSSKTKNFLKLLNCLNEASVQCITEKKITLFETEKQSMLHILGSKYCPPPIILLPEKLLKVVTNFIFVT